MGTKLFDAGREAFLNGLKAAHLAELSDKMNISIQEAGDAVSRFAGALESQDKMAQELGQALVRALEWSTGTSVALTNSAGRSSRNWLVTVTPNEHYLSYDITLLSNLPRHRGRDKELLDWRIYDEVLNEHLAGPDTFKNWTRAIARRWVELLDGLTGGGPPQRTHPLTGKPVSVEEVLEELKSFGVVLRHVIGRTALPGSVSIAELPPTPEEEAAAIESIMRAGCNCRTMPHLEHVDCETHIVSES